MYNTGEVATGGECPIFEHIICRGRFAVPTKADESIIVGSTERKACSVKKNRHT